MVNGASVKVKMADASIVVSIGAKSRQCRDLLGGVEGTGAEDGETELQLRQSRLTETREPSASCQCWTGGQGEWRRQGRYLWRDNRCSDSKTPAIARWLDDKMQSREA